MRAAHYAALRARLDDLVDTQSSVQRCETRGVTSSGIAPQRDCARRVVGDAGPLEFVTYQGSGENLARSTLLENGLYPGDDIVDVGDTGLFHEPGDRQYEGQR